MEIEVRAMEKKEYEAPKLEKAGVMPQVSTSPPFYIP